MNKKIIVGITSSGSVGLIQGQLKYFKKIGYTTYLLAPRTEKSKAYCENEGCELLAIDIKREINLFRDFISFIRILIIFIKIRPDIVNLGTPKVSLLGMVAARLIGVKRRIYTCRGLRYEHEAGIKRKILVMMERITSRSAHEVNCISFSVKNRGIADSIFSDAVSSVIHLGSSNGLDLDYFNPQGISELEKNSLRVKLNLEGVFVFGFLGRIIDRKGITELIEAFLKIYDENNNVRLLVVGPIEEVQLKNKEIIDLLRSHSGIVWPGRTDNVPLHLSIMDVFVLPAWWEGFGNVLIQAAAMGVAVISTNGTGTIDAVSDGYNGILVPVKDEISLERAMLKLFNDDRMRLEMGENGRTWAKNFDRRIIWEGINKLYLMK
jgi:glycosyltransferase involved in cell wall biosynthesis